MPTAPETRLTEHFGVRDPLGSAGTNRHEPWRQGSHAIVVGGSIAGLLAAEVLQRIEYERSRRRKYCFSITESEERADAAAFTTFASDLECEFHRRLENSQLAPRDLATQLLQNRDAHRAPASW